MAGSESGWRPPYDESTLRTKHQSRRSQVHHELSRELLLKEGTENLLRAKIDSKARKKAEMELSFYNCKLQLLREELNELNSSVLVYQTVGNATTRIPMLPIPMKETEPAKFNKVILPMLMNHYHVSSEDFSQPLEEINRMREMAQQPGRDNAGIELLFEYCNQLYFIDRRFYPSDRKPIADVYFQWFDLWSGTVAAQRSIAFEKANVMFNIAALYSQMAIEQDRATVSGLEEATELFEQSAGMLQLMSRAFVNSPSLDISSEAINALFLLMMAQAHECNWEQIMIKEQEGDVELAINIAKETCQVASSYRAVADAFDATKVLKDKIAPFWTAMVKLKHKHFQALTCFYAGIAHVEFLDDDLSQAETKEQHKLLMKLQQPLKSNVSSRNDQLYLGFLYFNAAVKLHEESQRLAGSSKEVKKLAAVQKILEMDRKNALSKVIELKRISQNVDLALLPYVKAEKVLGKPVAPVKPDFNKIAVVDFFRRLGPSSVFNANTVLGPPRDVGITQSDEGFGFVIRGNRPVKVRSVDSGSPAETAGLLRGDLIVAVNGEVAKFMTHDEVVGAIRFRGEHVSLTVMSPENVDQVLQASPTLSRCNSVVIHNVSGVRLDSDSPNRDRKTGSSVSEYASSTGLSGISEESGDIQHSEDLKSASTDDHKSADETSDQSGNPDTLDVEPDVAEEEKDNMEVPVAVEQTLNDNTQGSVESLNSGTQLEGLTETDAILAEGVSTQVVLDDGDDSDEGEYATAQQVNPSVQVQLAETMVAEDEDE